MSVQPVSSSSYPQPLPELPAMHPVNQGLVCSLPNAEASACQHHDDATHAHASEVCSEHDAEKPAGACSPFEPCKKEAGLNPKTGFENSLAAAISLLMEDGTANATNAPARILFVGGCRMPSLARYLALQLPGTGLVLADADARWVERAKQMIGCRYAFEHIDPLQLPFESDRFGMTLVLNSAAALGAHEPEINERLMSRWMSQLARVTHNASGGGQLIWGELQSGFLFKTMGKHLPEMPEALEQWGIDDAVGSIRTPKLDALMRLLFRYGRVNQRLMPYPWRLFSTQLHAIREDRLRLA
ncbi:MAG: hypothetical protein VKJ06_04715 [Vampirovibrionales bacterium]|nr:hypothetical protein [Vampirovibrionales bacterium]